MKNSYHLLPLSLLFALVACGGGGGGGGSTPGIENREPYLSPINGDPVSQFEAWKKKIVKTCSIEAIFGGEPLSSVRPGIDVDLLFAQNNHSAVFVTENDLLILNEVKEQFQGRYAGNLNRNGFRGKVEISGDKCIVTMNSKEVFNSVLAESVSVGTHIKGEASEETLAVAAKVLGVTANEVQKLVSLAPSLNTVILKDETTGWNLLQENLVLTNPVVEMRLPSPEVLLNKQVLNKNDKKLVAFKGEYSTDGSFRYVNYIGTKDFNLNEAKTCLGSKSHLALTEGLGICNKLDPSLSTAILDDENAAYLRELVLGYFEQNPTGRDRSWSNHLKYIVREHVKAERDVRSLDPEGQIPLIARIAQNVELLNQHGQLALVTGDDGVDLAIMWAITFGNNDELREILDVTHSLVGHFPESVGYIIERLAVNPLDEEGRSSLEFARSVRNDKRYLEAAFNALVAARRKQDNNFLSRYNWILQDRISVGYLERYARSIF